MKITKQKEELTPEQKENLLFNKIEWRNIDPKLMKSVVIKKPDWTDEVKFIRQALIDTLNNPESTQRAMQLAEYSLRVEYGNNKKVFLENPKIVEQINKKKRRNIYFGLLGREITIEQLSKRMDDVPNFIKSVESELKIKKSML